MNGNTPYAGTPGVVEAGQPAQDAPEMTREQRRTLRAGVAGIADRTRDLLPSEYAVGSEITAGARGPEVTVAVRPPVGNPVSAGFVPEFDEDDAELIDASEQAEVARGLAASAALQVKQALDADEEFEATAK